jgi:plasmid maintenance system killer protein
LLRFKQIRSFKDRKTEDFFGGDDNVRQFSSFKKAAERKLVMLNSAVKLGDLAASRGNSWKSCQETGPDNTVSGSTTDGGSVLIGKMTVRTTWNRRLSLRSNKMNKNGMRPVPPGEILNEEFLKPLGLTANALAKAIGVPANRITAILKDERGIRNVFQNVGGILDEPANDLRLAERRESAAGEGEKEHRREQARTAMIRKNGKSLIVLTAS